MNDIILHYKKFRAAVNGLVLPTPDGDYIIFINSMLSTEQQREAFNHEVKHLLEGHFEQGRRPIAQLEAEANAKSVLLEQIKDAEANGLPLQTAIMSKRPPPPQSEKPNPYSTFTEKKMMKWRRYQLTGLLR